MSDMPLERLTKEVIAVENARERIDLELKIISERRLAGESFQKWVAMVVAILAASLTAAGLGIQLYNSNRLREQEIVNRQKEFSLRFYEKQIDAYSEICSKAGELAERKASQADLDEFNRISTGKLLLVSDQMVQLAAARFQGCLYTDVNLGGQPHRPLTMEVERRRWHEKIDALWTLCEACRESLKLAFPSINLGELDRETWQKKFEPPIPPPE